MRPASQRDVPAAMKRSPLAHRSAGAGPPLLLINGELMSMASWQPIASALEARFTVHRCDLRGQLLSPGSPFPRLSGHLPDLVGLLDAAGVAQTHVVGTSCGALIGLLLAATHPSRVQSVAAVAATERITPEAWQAMRPVLDACDAAGAGSGEDCGRVFDLLVPATFSPRYVNGHATELAERRGQIAALPHAWFIGLAGLLRSLEGVDLTLALPQIRCAALVVAAADDLTFPPERSSALAAEIPNATLEIVAESGHALVAERPEALLELLQAFLARIGPQKGPA